jgi:hypothetical protein
LGLGTNLDNNFVTLMFVFVKLHRLLCGVEGLSCKEDALVEIYMQKARCLLSLVVNKYYAVTRSFFLTKSTR